MERNILEQLEVARKSQTDLYMTGFDTGHALGFIAALNEAIYLTEHVSFNYREGINVQEAIEQTREAVIERLEDLRRLQDFKR